MNRTTTSFVLIVIALATQATVALARTPTHLWSKSFGSWSNDAATAIATDNDGNVFMCGYFQGAVDFGGGNLVSGGNTDVFLAKYDLEGNHLWSKSFGWSGSDVVYGIATDAQGNVLITGYYNYNVDFGGGPLPNHGGSEVFLAKYGPDGTHKWSRGFGSSGSDLGYAVTTDTQNAVYVTGYYFGTPDLGTGSLPNSGGVDLFLAKYDANGSIQWSRGFGGPGSDVGHSLTVDGGGNLVLTGWFDADANLGGGVLATSGGEDCLLAKYTSTGTYLWAKSFGNYNNGDRGYGVIADGSDLIVTGSFFGPVDFGGSPLSSQSTDVFLARFDSAGDHVWSKAFGGTSSDEGFGLSLDQDSNILFTGVFHGTIDLGNGVVNSAGDIDFFLAKVGPNGSPLWSQRFGGIEADYGYGVATDSNGDVFVGGLFRDSVDFGGLPLTSAGGFEVFLARYASNSAEPLITAIGDIPNDQGRVVKVRFSASGHDRSDATPTVASYEVYRRDDPAPSVAGQRTLLDDGWTYLASVPPHEQTSYAVDVPTIGDSTETFGPYYSTFFVRASTGMPGTYYDSPADSGYSTDNLAPGIPGSLGYGSGVLSWNETTAADFDYYTVYGGSSAAFGTATLVNYTIIPQFDVSASPYDNYFVTATDFSGNEGDAIHVRVASGAGGTPQSYVLSVSNFPNPFNPNTSVNYTVPVRGNVSISIFDARGARVAVLVNNELRDVGAYRVEWVGRDDRGIAVPSGIYFVRIEQAGATRTHKVVLLK